MNLERGKYVMELFLQDVRDFVNMRRTIILLIIICFSSVTTFAYDVVMNGLSYNKLTENAVALASVDTLYSGHLEIPEAIQLDGNTMKVTSISRRALENCKRITSVDLPNSIVEIEYRAFYNCTNLQTVNLQSGITTLGYGVFENCYGLEKLTIPNTVTSMGSDLFRDCRSLRSVSLPSQITKLPERLFLRCEKLNGIELPQSIQYIKASVFNGCKSLQEIVLPDNLISIGLYAFDGSGIKSIIIPNGVKTIDSYSFHNCENLSSVKLSESIIKISDFCFCGCSNLSSISLPKTITAIGKHAFQQCSAMNSIDITENVESIGEYAFAECSNLRSVVLPNSLKSIGQFCFYQSGKINVRSYIIKPFKVDITVFSGLDKDAVLYVPRGTKEEYQSVGGWGNFNIVEMEDYPDSFSLKIIVSGNGNVSYKEEAFRNTTKTFTIEEGTNATITFKPDNGYRLKSVVVNNYNVTSSVSNNSYTISNIGRNTTVEVEFEAISTITYSLSIKATGNGSASYIGTTVRNKTSTFTVNEGTNATITFTPDNGYRIKSLVVNNADETANFLNNTYKISSISRNITVEVVFEEDGPKQLINGHEYVDLDLPSGRYWSTVNYGAKNPEDAGSYFNNSSKNDWGEYWRTPTQEEFQELIDECEWTWIDSGINGFSIKGRNGNMMFLPAAGYFDLAQHNYNIGSSLIGGGSTASEYPHINEIAYYWTLGGAYKVGDKSGIKMQPYSGSTLDQMPIRPISTVKNESVFTKDGLNYMIVSSEAKTVNIAKGSYGKVLEVPQSVTYPDKEWKIVGIDDEVLHDNEELSAIIWNPEVPFTNNVSNPNLLLYISSANYAPQSIKNVVVNNIADNITLIDAADGNNFYCPLEFTAKSISYTHHYKMESGINESKGWETI